jgi:hypothetical protein
MRCTAVSQNFGCGARVMAADISIAIAIIIAMRFIPILPV